MQNNIGQHFLRALMKASSQLPAYFAHSRLAGTGGRNLAQLDVLPLH